MFIKFANIRPDQIEEYQYRVPLHLIYQNSIHSIVAKTYELAGTIASLDESRRR